MKQLNINSVMAHSIDVACGRAFTWGIGHLVSGKDWWLNEDNFGCRRDIAYSTVVNAMAIRRTSHVEKENLLLKLQSCYHVFQVYLVEHKNIYLPNINFLAEEISEEALEDVFALCAAPKSFTPSSVAM